MSTPGQLDHAAPAADRLRPFTVAVQLIGVAVLAVDDGLKAGTLDLAALSPDELDDAIDTIAFAIRRRHALTTEVTR